MWAALIRDTVGEQLELVVSLGGVTAVTLLNQAPHEVSCFLLILVQNEPVLKVLYSIGLETGQPGESQKKSPQKNSLPKTHPLADMTFTQAASLSAYGRQARNALTHNSSNQW